MVNSLFAEKDLPAPVLQGAAEISKDGCLRWTLRRWWGDGPKVCFIGLNPSTADNVKDDPTVRRWTHFARAWGYHGFVAVNLFPFRTSSPNECKGIVEFEKNGPDWYARDEMQHNMGVVAKEAKLADLVVACWGVFRPWMSGWVDTIVEGIVCGEEPWPDLHCFAKSKHGDPVHPMARGQHRIPDDAMPQLWKEGHRA